MRYRKVVADAGPLIAFGRLDRFNLLAGVCGEVIVPAAVASECLDDLSKPGARAIRAAIDSGRLRLFERQGEPTAAFPSLDVGESAAIRLAAHLAVPVLIDERIGRRVASGLGLSVIGSAGVLLQGKRLGLIERVSPLLDGLREHGYHFSEQLIRAVLERAGEG